MPCLVATMEWKAEYAVCTFQSRSWDPGGFRQGMFTADTCSLCRHFDLESDGLEVAMWLKNLLDPSFALCPDGSSSRSARVRREDS